MQEALVRQLVFTQEAMEASKVKKEEVQWQECNFVSCHVVIRELMAVVVVVVVVLLFCRNSTVET